MLINGYLQFVCAKSTMKMPSKLVSHILPLTRCVVSDLGACPVSSGSSTRYCMKSRFPSRFLLHFYRKCFQSKLPLVPLWMTLTCVPHDSVTKITAVNTNYGTEGSSLQ
ncbi:hypothetical protein TNIN_208711 [Trichonephila inaurata madagascariensis]|uniref:Uncharacterized protein n=1 Tax=Trichonephila inaurata madagascariensis TaxID=2747483 RepID=A0A8X6Y4V4_9ARAC|nr:hypothetical protein TNIN_208711 [Trichonephila inaurata madagascariensis]